jgi:hypothetical protein
VIEAHRKGQPLPERLIGLPTGLTESDFRELLAGFLERLEQRSLASKPGATVLLEKTPASSGRVEFINWLQPETPFIHLVRDGRQVAASLNRLSSSWGAQWAPDDPIRAARKWRKAVEDSRAAAHFDDRYRELRYEQLRADPEAQVPSVLEWLGLDTSMVDKMVSSPASLLTPGQVGQLVDTWPGEPPGFRGSDIRDRGRLWHALVEREAGDLLDDLGYDVQGEQPRSVGLVAAVLGLRRELRRALRGVHELRRSHRERS